MEKGYYRCGKHHTRLVHDKLLLTTLNISILLPCIDLLNDYYDKKNYLPFLTFSLFHHSKARFYDCVCKHVHQISESHLANTQDKNDGINLPDFGSLPISIVKKKKKNSCDV